MFAPVTYSNTLYHSNTQTSSDQVTEAHPQTASDETEAQPTVSVFSALSVRSSLEHHRLISPYLFDPYYMLTPLSLYRMLPTSPSQKKSTMRPNHGQSMNTMWTRKRKRRAKEIFWSAMACCATVAKPTRHPLYDSSLCWIL